MSYKNIPFGAPEKFNAVVEIPKGSEVKYEYDEDLDAIKLDWIFTNGFNFPFDYGYIPETRGGDGDHLDAFVLGSRSVALGTIVECRAIGMIELLDRGEKDNKILAAPIADPASQKYEKLDDLPFDYKTIFEEFFRELGAQKNKTVEIKGFRDKTAALQELESAHKNFA
ncbi:inorganic diphosphatase [Candidatus Wolfebacteria bacterium]|nr:inorganic diphosphatase [Candidatus Wolfebacteria bacterium]